MAKARGLGEERARPLSPWLPKIGARGHPCGQRQGRKIKRQAGRGEKQQARARHAAAWNMAADAGAAAGRAKSSPGCAAQAARRRTETRGAAACAEAGQRRQAKMRRGSGGDGRREPRNGKPDRARAKHARRATAGSTASGRTCAAWNTASGQASARAAQAAGARHDGTAIPRRMTAESSPGRQTASAKTTNKTQCAETVSWHPKYTRVGELSSSLQLLFQEEAPGANPPKHRVFPVHMVESDANKEH